MENNAMVATANKLLYSKQEVMEMLDVGERTFRGLMIPYVKVGKSRKYRISDLQTWINRQAEDPACLSPAKGKARRTTGTTSRSTVIGFDEALKLTNSHWRSQSLPSCVPKP